MIDSPVLTRDLRLAVADEGLSIAYQPIFELGGADAEAERLVSVEALSRWSHPEVGEVAPAQFIPLAERAGFLDDLDVYVLAHAGEQLHAWQEAGHAIGLSVNASPSHISTRYVDALVARLDELSLLPGSLTVEIIEVPSPQLLPAMEESFTLLHQAGVSIAVDDFGAGDTTYEMLRMLPIDEVKIDRRLTRSDSAESDDVVRRIVELAEAHDWRVVAEGIETQDDLDRARQRGCRRGQGYLLGRPTDPDEIERLLSGRGQIWA
jgi:EAL domain-containing protein (putative c-di-GMP-specific phosphodiesterase class I)